MDLFKASNHPRWSDHEVARELYRTHSDRHAWAIMINSLCFATLVEGTDART